MYLRSHKKFARIMHRLIAEARRLGLDRVRIQCANSSPRLAAQFNGEPINVPLGLMLSDLGDPALALLQLHQQLRIPLWRH